MVDEIGSHGGQPIVVPFRHSEVNSHILADHKADFAQSLTEQTNPFLNPRS
jgi:hypothetical protein